VRQSSEDGAPECPQCHGDTAWQPAGISIAGNASRAMNAVQQIAEKQYGLTDFKDNTREGESVFKMTPVQSKMADGFFAGQNVQIGQNAIPASTILAGARPSAADNPIALLHKAQKGIDPLAFRNNRK
jgi:hypothetical protein